MHIPLTFIPTSYQQYFKLRSYKQQHLAVWQHGTTWNFQRKIWFFGFHRELEKLCKVWIFMLGYVFWLHCVSFWSNKHENNVQFFLHFYFLSAQWFLYGFYVLGLQGIFKIFFRLVNFINFECNGIQGTTKIFFKSLQFCR